MVTRIPVEKTAADTADVSEQIRALAYHLFESRGGSDGRDLDDWLAAERELIVAPNSEVVQRDSRFEIRLPVEGYDPQEIHVSALPGSLVVKAAPEQAGKKILLRTIDLPEPIDADRTTARLDNGILYVTAMRQKQEREPAAV